MDRLLWVCAGSAVGGGARYLLSSWATGLIDARFPLGTLVVNLFGSFLMGALMYAGAEAGRLSPAALVALTTGVMGGFTTYSAFSYETMRSLQGGAWAVAAGNVVATVLGCLAACLAGWACARVVLA